MLHSSLTAKCYQNPLSGRKVARVLVIYTGGTIGMKDNADGGINDLLDLFCFVWNGDISKSANVFKYDDSIDLRKSDFTNFFFFSSGYTVVPNYFAQALKRLPMLYDEDYVESGMPELSNECEMDPNLPYCKYPKLVMP